MSSRVYKIRPLIVVELLAAKDTLRRASFSKPYQMNDYSIFSKAT